jgi:hypothetical protein
MTETTPLHVDRAWMGNGQAVEAKHYLQVADEHFAESAQLRTESGAVSG